MEKIIHMYFHGPSEAKIDLLLTMMNNLAIGISTMSGTLDTALDTLRANVARLTAVEDSVEAFVAGVPGLIEEAVKKATAAGATPAQLAAFTELNETLAAKAEEIAGDVVANTPDPVDPAA